MNDTVFPLRAADVLGILEVEEVVDEVPFRGELAERKNGEFAWGGAGIGGAEVPDFKFLIERNEVGRFRADGGVSAFDNGVAGTEASDRLVLVEGFAAGLPSGTPEVARGGIAEVELASRHIHGDGVVAVAQDAPLGRGTGEGISSGVVGDDAAVGAGAKVVAPCARRVRSIDGVFKIPVVKVTIFHNVFLSFKSGVVVC